MILLLKIPAIINKDGYTWAIRLENYPSTKGGLNNEERTKQLTTDLLC